MRTFRGKTLIVLGTLAASLAIGPVALAQEAKQPSFEEYSYYTKAQKETDFAKKEAALFEFLEKYPDSSLMKNVRYEFQVLFNGLFKEKQFDKAIAVANKLAEVMKEDLLPTQYLAQAYYQKGDNANFIVHAEKLYAKYPSSQSAYYLATSALAVGDYAKVDQYAGDVEAKQGGPAMLADLYFKIQQTTAGKNDDISAKYAQKAADLLENKPTLEGFQGDWKAFRGHIFTQSVMYLGRRAVAADKNADAAVQFERLIKDDPKNADGYFFKGLALYAGGEAKAAAEAFARAIVLNKPTVSDNASKKLDEIISATGADATERTKFLDAAKAALGVQ